MLNNKFKNKSGMTLVELLVAIVIFSTVLGLAYRIYIDSVKYIDKENIKTQLQSEAQIIDSTFLQLGMQSEGIEKISLSDSTGEFQNGDYVDMKYKNDNDEYTYMRWKLEDNILKLQIINSYDESKVNQIIENEYILSENIKDFKINSISDNSLEESSIIRVDISLEKRKGFSYVEYPFSVMITFRNKN